MKHHLHVDQLVVFIFTTILFATLIVVTIWYWAKKRISGNALFLGVWNCVWVMSISYDALSLHVGYHRALIAIHITMNLLGVIFFLIRVYKSLRRRLISILIFSLQRYLFGFFCFSERNRVSDASQTRSWS